VADSERTDALLRAPAAESREVVFAPSIAIRPYFSTYWLFAARCLSGLAGEIEASHEGRSRFDAKHRSYVLASVQASASFLEAMVNELYQDAADGHGVAGDGYLAPLPENTRAQMAEVWAGTDEGRRLDTLTKYQLLLTLAERERLDRGAQPFQDAALLVDLRNRLVHFRPESISADDKHRMERLRGKFADSRLMTGAGNPWWPDHCLGHGLSEWARTSAKAFADEVVDELGITPNYRRVDFETDPARSS